MNAYILYGGRGTRVASLMEKYNVTNKHCLPVDGHPFVDYVERSLHSSSMIDNVVRLEGNTGTGGAIRDIGRISYPYILTCGDMLVDGLDMSIQGIYGSYLMYNADVVMVTMEVNDVDYGRLYIRTSVIDYSMRITQYVRKHDTTGDYYTNVGMYLIGERFHNFLLDYPQINPLSLELDIFENGNILGTDRSIFSIFNIIPYRIDSKYIFDIGTISRYEDTNNRLKWQ